MIVITTPTGQVGRQTLDAVLDVAPVRVIVRDPDRLSGRVRERVEVVVGSHDDADTVAAAFAGADSVFWLVPPTFANERPTDHYLAFAEAARAALTTQRVVAVSTMGRGQVRDGGPLTAAFAMDELIESTGVPYRAVRPPAFMENLLGQVESIHERGTIVLPNAADRVLPMAATRDIAAAAARLLADGTWTGQGSVSVVSPDRLTPTEMADVVGAVLGRRVRFEQISAEDYRATLTARGLSEAWARGMADLAAAQDAGGYDAETRAAEPAPTTFRQWCTEALDIPPCDV